VFKGGLLSWGLLVLSVCFNALGAIVIKSKLNEFGPFKLDSITSIAEVLFYFLRSPLVIGSTILFFSSPFLFAAALSRLPITLAYPVQIALNFLLVLSVAVFWMNEKLSVLQAIGVLLILVGILMINKTT